MSIKERVQQCSRLITLLLGKGFTAIHCITATLTYQQNDCAVHH